MEAFTIGWVLCGIIGAMIGSRKGAGCSGFLLGILLGPLGIIISAVMRGDRKPCSHCRELIRKDAVKCPKCGTVLSDSQQIHSRRVIKWVKKCPRCAELIKKDAMICRYCRHEFTKEEIISKLLAALEGDAQSRIRSIACLSRIEDISVAQHLLKALIDAESDFTDPLDFVPVQDKAKMALLKIGDKSIIPKIESIVKQGGEQRVVVISVKLLGEFGDPSSVPVLIDALEHEATRRDAAVALHKIGRPAVALLDNARKERNRAVRKVAKKILKAIDSES